METFTLTLGLLCFSPLVHSSKVWVAPPAFPCPEFPLFPCICTRGSDEGVDVVCENTNLASMAVGLRQAQVKIENLTLVNCNVEKLYGDMLRTLNVTRLVVNLQLLPNLKKIKIDKSDLEEIPPNTFKGLSKLIEIQISNARVKTLDKEAFSGQRKLKFLRLHHNNISGIVKKTFDFGKSLDLLDLSYNKIGALQPTHFNQLGKLLWLNLTSNGIKTFNSRIFSRNQVLAVLHLAENNITKLDASSFRGMRFMRRLYFENNQISQIGRQTFQALRRIGGIYLRGNKMKKIDYQMFDGLQFADSIDVSHNLITRVDKNAFKGLYLATINMSYNAIETLPAGVFQQCDNVTVDLSYNQVSNIDPEAFDEFSYTFEFNISHNSLTDFSQIPMKYQKGIKMLDVSYNQIVEIPKATFPKLYELNTINLSHNNLTKIGRSVFTPLFSIRHLDFSHNHLEKIESSTFGKIPTVLDIDLSYNRLKSIRRGAFGNLVSIRSIKLDHNELKEIPRPPISLNHLYMAHNNVSTIRGRAPWPVMNSLISLDLDHNNFGDNLGGGRFNGLNVLQSLKLRSNGMTRPPYEALGALQSLRNLHLDGNNLTKLEKKAFGRLPVVFVLGLSDNQLVNISTQAFEGLLQLIDLNLSSNNLTFIPPGAFQSLVALQHLDLSHNKLKKLENKTHGLLDDCLSIKSVNLSHNLIPFVTKRMFPESRWIPYKLEEVDLSHNMMPVLTSGMMVGTKHLQRLNLSHNILNDIRKYVLGNLTALHSLDLSHNKLTESKLRKDRWGGPYSGILPNLSYFSLAHNNLYSIPANLLAQFPKLTTLDLAHNDLLHYYPDFTSRVKEGLDLKYEGNVLRCECSLRPVVHWLRAGARTSTSWSNAHCHSPGYLAGKAVDEVREEQLVCDNFKEADTFKISPDVKFRDVDETSSSLSVSWYVNTNEDVADFRVELATLGGKDSKTGIRARPRTLLVKDLGYKTRYDVIDSIPGGEELRMCLLVKTSLGRIRRWRQDQCQSVGPFSDSVKFSPTFPLLVGLVVGLLASVRM